MEEVTSVGFSCVEFSQVGSDPCLKVLDVGGEGRGFLDADRWGAFWSDCMNQVPGVVCTGRRHLVFNITRIGVKGFASIY